MAQINSLQDILWSHTLKWVVSLTVIIYILRRLQGCWRWSVFYHTKDIPCTKGYPIIGHILQFWGSPEYVFQKMRSLNNSFNGLHKTWNLNRLIVHISTPEDAEPVFSSAINTKKSDVYKLLRSWLGNGLLLDFGNSWFVKRKNLTPAFHFNILQRFMNPLAEQSKRFVDMLEFENSKTEGTDVVKFVTEFALHVLCETTMGVKLDKHNKEINNYKQAILRYGQLMFIRIFRPWLFYDIIFYRTELGREARELEKTLHGFTHRIIDERLANWDESVLRSDVSASGKKRLAMLDLLVVQMKRTHEIDIQNIKEEVDTFVFAGHDTTSMGLSFTLLLLANNKFAQERIYEELYDIFGDDKERLPTFEELQKMKYLEMCIKESHRLYPPVPLISRDMIEDLTISNHVIPKGVKTHVHIYDIHRNPEHWKKPDMFDPDRFLPDAVVNRHPFAYIPFSAGIRNCIGQKFAQLEEKTFFSTLLRKYYLEPIDTPETVTLIADIVLRPKGPIRVKFCKRN